MDEALVMDVGGTSTDIGAVAGGFPRESAAGTDIGGVPTNFRMPDIVTLALGGGSIVGEGSIGPRSVGFRLTQEALVFGGSTATFTDAAVAMGRADIGTRRPDPSRALRETLNLADEMFADGVDRAKTAKGDRPLIAVGGGSVLVPDRLPGVSQIHRPENYDVANAIGAAVAEVGGQVEEIVHGDLDRRRPEIERLSEEARSRAVEAGADPGSVRIVDIEEVPLAYLTSPAVRVRVRAAGPMAL
jgi:N-methylhydantoinase A/oxoprolinase/acetone carboxylase beta subunit